MMRIAELLTQHQLSDINSVNINGDTVFHLAVKNDKLTTHETIEVLKVMLEKDLDPNIKNNKKETILHLATANRAKDVIDFLLTRGVHFDDSVAAYLINSECNKTINRKEDFPISDSERQTLEIESASFVEWILSKGLNINCPDITGTTAFTEAFEIRNLQHVLHILLDYANDLDYTEVESDRTLLHIFVESIASERDFYESYTKKKWFPNYTQRYAAGVIKALLDKGISADSLNVAGNTALHSAISDKLNFSIIEILINRTTIINHKNFEGGTPFYEAIYNWSWSKETETEYYLKILRALLAKGANVNESKKYGTTPLCTVVERNHLKAVEFLLESGADFSVITNDGENLLHLFVKKSYAIKTDDETQIKLFNILIGNGCEVNAKDNSGKTPLHISANDDDILIVQKLIEHGAEIDARNNRNQTPLWYLANYNQKTKAAQLLLDHGANINAKDHEGFTPLHAVAVGSSWNRNVDMLKFLLRNGADFNDRTDEAHSVVLMALWRDYNEDSYEDDTVEPHELPNLITCIEDYASDKVEILLRHWIKLDVAKLKCYHDNDYNRLIKKKKYKKIRGKCLAEIEKLKNNFIGSHMSLYKFLHMNVNSRRAYINNEKLQQLMQSLKFEEEFPEYSVLILSSYREAITRKLILEPAKTTWLELTEIMLPEVCIELVFSFLSNSELFVFIERN